MSNSKYDLFDKFFTSDEFLEQDLLELLRNFKVTDKDLKTLNQNTDLESNRKLKTLIEVVYPAYNNYFIQNNKKEPESIDALFNLKTEEGQKNLNSIYVDIIPFEVLQKSQNIKDDESLNGTSGIEDMAAMINPTRLKYLARVKKDPKEHQRLKQQIEDALAKDKIVDKKVADLLKALFQKLKYGKNSIDKNLFGPAPKEPPAPSVDNSAALNAADAKAKEATEKLQKAEAKAQELGKKADDAVKKLEEAEHKLNLKIEETNESKKKADKELNTAKQQAEDAAKAVAAAEIKLNEEVAKNSNLGQAKKETEDVAAKLKTDAEEANQAKKEAEEEAAKLKTNAEAANNAKEAANNAKEAAEAEAAARKEEAEAAKAAAAEAASVASAAAAELQKAREEVKNLKAATEAANQAVQAEKKRFQEELKNFTDPLQKLINQVTAEVEPVLRKAKELKDQQVAGVAVKVGGALPQDNKPVDGQNKPEPVLTEDEINDKFKAYRKSLVKIMSEFDDISKRYIDYTSQIKNYSIINEADRLEEITSKYNVQYLALNDYMNGNGETSFKKIVTDLNETVKSLNNYRQQFEPIFIGSKDDKELKELKLNYTNIVDGTTTKPDKTAEVLKSTEDEKDTKEEKLKDMSLEELYTIFLNVIKAFHEAKKNSASMVAKAIKENTSKGPSDNSYSSLKGHFDLKVSEFRTKVNGYQPPENYEDKYKNIKDEFNRIIDEIKAPLDISNNNVQRQEREQANRNAFNKELDVIANHLKAWNSAVHAFNTNDKEDDTITKIRSIQNDAERIRKRFDDLKKVFDQVYEYRLKRANPAFIASAATREPSLFNKIYAEYMNDKMENQNDQEKAVTIMVNKLDDNNLIPRKILEPSQTDKIVFVFITLFLRMFSLSIVRWVIVGGYLKTMKTALAVYMGSYTALLLIAVLIINLDSYRMRIVFNYLNMHGNRSRIMTHVGSLWIFGYLIYLVMYYLNIRETQGLVERVYTEEDKARIIYRIEVLSMIIWLLLVIIILLV